MQDLSPQQQTAETILRRAAGVRERVRADLIFTFDSLNWTKRYFIGKPGRSVYQPEVDERDVVHSADMQLFNQIAELNADTSEAEALAQRYWEGDTGNGEREEHLCAARLFTPDQRLALKDELYPMVKQDHGDKEFYESMFDRLKQ
jgi:hypothetical protein